jgi:hypothetical protein
MKMRKTVLFFLSVCLLLYCVSCGGTNAGREEVTFTESVSSEAAPYMEATYSPSTNDPNTEEESMNAQKTKLMLEIGGTVLSATLAENSTVEALIELLKEPLSLDMEDYAGFEKGAPLPEELPQNNEPMDTDAGDVILYQGRQFVIYYDENSWSLTPLAHIDDISKEDLKKLLGEGNVTVTIWVE